MHEIEGQSGPSEQARLASPLFRYVFAVNFLDQSLVVIFQFHQQVVILLALESGHNLLYYLSCQHVLQPLRHNSSLSLSFLDLFLVAKSLLFDDAPSHLIENGKFTVFLRLMVPLDLRLLSEVFPLLLEKHLLCDMLFDPVISYISIDIDEGPGLLVRDRGSEPLLLTSPHFEFQGCQVALRLFEAVSLLREISDFLFDLVSN